MPRMGLEVRPMAKGVNPHYTGSFLAVELDKPSYQVGETVRVRCRVRVTRSAMEARYNIWYSEIRAYNVAGVPRRITQIRATHTASPGRADEAIYEASLNLGRQTEEGLRIRLELWAGTRRPPAPPPPGEPPPPPAPIPI